MNDLSCQVVEKYTRSTKPDLCQTVRGDSRTQTKQRFWRLDDNGCLDCRHNTQLADGQISADEIWLELSADSHHFLDSCRLKNREKEKSEY